MYWNHLISATLSDTSSNIEVLYLLMWRPVLIIQIPLSSLPENDHRTALIKQIPRQSIHLIWTTKMLKERTHEIEVTVHKTRYYSHLATNCTSICELSQWLGLLLRPHTLLRLCSLHCTGGILNYPTLINCSQRCQFPINTGDNWWLA